MLGTYLSKLSRIMILQSIVLAASSLIGCSEKSSTEIKPAANREIIGRIIGHFDATKDNPQGEENENINIFPFSANVRHTTDAVYIFSPISQHKIWQLENGGPAYEFNPQTGEWKSLEPIFGKFARFLHKGSVRDSIETNLSWIACTDGVLEYDSSTGNISFYKTANYEITTSIITQKEYIFLATTNGLYAISRKDKVMREVKEFQHMNIQKLYYAREKLWIESSELFTYDISNRKIENISKKIDCPSSERLQHDAAIRATGFYFTDIIFGKEITTVLTFNCTSPLLHNNETFLLDKDNNKIANLKYLPADFAFQEDDRLLWLMGHANDETGHTVNFAKYDIQEKKPLEKFAFDKTFQWFYPLDNYFYLISEDRFGRFNKNTGVVEAYPAQAYNYFVDEQNFWIVTDKSLIRMNKRNNDNLFLPFEETIDIENKIRTLRNNIGQDKNLAAKIKDIVDYFQLFKKFKNTLNITDIDYLILRALKVEDAKLLDVESYIKSTDVAAEKEICYFMMISGTLYSEKPHIALEYYNLLKKEFPFGDILSRFQPSDGELIELAALESERIKSNKDFSEDEKLWYLGTLFMKVSNVSWNEGEVGSILTYPFKILEELIQTYPDSKWTAEAEFEMMSVIEGAVHEGGDTSLDCINGYENFIAKHPTSRHVPEAKLAIADHYFNFVDMTNNDPEGYIEKAKKLNSEVKKTYPNSEYATRALENIKQINLLENKMAEQRE